MELNKVVQEWESGTHYAERAMEIISGLLREVDRAEGQIASCGSVDIGHTGVW